MNSFIIYFAAFLGAAFIITGLWLALFGKRNKQMPVKCHD